MTQAAELSSKVNVNTIVLEAAAASLVKKKPPPPKPVLPSEYYGRGKPSSYVFNRGAPRSRLKSFGKKRGRGRGSNNPRTGNFSKQQQEQ